MVDIKVYSSDSKNEDIIKKELARRERVKERRKQDPKYRGTILTIGALSILASLGATNIAKNMIDTKIAEQEISTSSDYSKTEEETKKKKIGDIFLDDTDIREKEAEKEGEGNAETITAEPPIIKSNVNEVLEMGDVVEFERAYVGRYEFTDEYGGTWSVKNENDDSQNIEWCFASHRENGNYGYVTVDSLEEFKPYISSSDGIYYRTILDRPTDGKIDCSIGDTVYVDDSKVYTSKEGYQYFKYLIQNEYEEHGRTKYHYMVVYAGTTLAEKSDKEFSLGLVKNKTAMRTSPELKGNIYEFQNDASEKGVKYIVDISSYSPATFQDYMDTIKTLQAKGLLGGVIMEIARSHESNYFNVQSITDGAELDGKVNSIAGKTNNTLTGSMGNYNYFKDYVEQTMQICPVGFYVYVDTIHKENANQLAEIVYETEKKLSNDIPGFNQATKLPIMVDVEDGGNSKRQERTDAVISCINRLADLNVIDNQYMFYTSPTSVVAKKEDINSGTQITCIEDVQEGTPNLTLINVGASYVNGMLNISSNQDAYKENLEPENLLRSMYATEAYTQSFYMSPKNIAQADIMQCMGNINSNNVTVLQLKSSQLIDISVCTTGTLNAILNGNFKGHEGTYLSNMADAISKAKIQNKSVGDNVQNMRKSRINERKERE